MNKIIVKTPGKLMLLGEHAVVYGYPCVVTAINRYLTVEAEIIDDAKDQLVTPDVSDQRFINEALKLFHDIYTIGEKVKVTTKSELGNYGLGSSAATVVATLKALSLLFEIPMADRQLFDLGLQVVLSIQGKASGFDIAATIFGGTIYFDGRTKEVIPLTNEPLPIIVVFSGIKADTVSLIQMVSQKRQNYKKGIDAIFENIEKLVLEAKIAMEEKDWKRVGTMMNYNQSYLEDLGVSTNTLNTLTSTALKAGAWGAKLSGAGGGDCMIALVSDEKKEGVKKALLEAGGEVLELQTSVWGTHTIV